LNGLPLKGQQTVIEVILKNDKCGLVQLTQLKGPTSADELHCTALK
jgi:hypothetical protein